VRLQASLGAVPPCAPLLGRDERGGPLLAYLPAPEVSHILIAGVAGSGKTALLRTIVSSLALANDPDDLRVLLIGAKRGELAQFEGLPHLVAPPIHNRAEAGRRLAWLAEEMAWREQSGVRVPRVVVAVDDVDNLLGRAGDVDTALAARGHAVGIHLVLSTRHVMAPAAKALLPNIPCRLVGRVENWREAVVAAGIKRTGAEKLAGRGDFLLVAGGETVRFQAALITPEEIAVMAEMLQRELAWGQTRENRRRNPWWSPWPAAGPGGWRSSSARWRGEAGVSRQPCSVAIKSPRAAGAFLAGMVRPPRGHWEGSGYSIPCSFAGGKSVLPSWRSGILAALETRPFFRNLNPTPS
jgi:hypothetical protein